MFRYLKATPRWQEAVRQVQGSYGEVYEVPMNAKAKTDEEAEKCYIHNMFRVNKVSTKQDIWNFGKATKKSRFS